MKYMGVKLTFSFLYIMTCLINFFFIRDLVYSFLLSTRKDHEARKIHRQQPLSKRLTLGYIKDYAIYPKHFSFFHKAYIVYFFLIFAQYMVFVGVYMLDNEASAYVLMGLYALQIIIFVLIQTQYSNKISRFDKRYKRLFRKKR